ncbi:MAG: DUF1275 domain-containing protein [Verrucomicrobia bacterium]|nr:DUF1275 domain-containing protein [Verrucomicrobiota bacterium]MBV9674354.1 DUF1275 domain-containing protein [Verrucomicrobiota bacterium]
MPVPKTHLQTLTSRIDSCFALSLSAVAGAVDAIAYLQVSSLFVANQTGNTVWLGVNLASGQWSEAFRHFSPILAFLGGIIFSRLLLNIQPGKSQRTFPIIAVPLISASALLAVAAFVLPRATGVFVPWLSFSLGMQNAAYTRVDGVSLNTAFITGDLEKLGEALVNRWTGKDPQQTGKASNLILLVWSFYLVGAAAGCALAHYFRAGAFLFPAGLMVATAGLLIVNYQKTAKSKA